MSTACLLAADVGGTRTTIALARESGAARPEIVAQQSYPSQRFDGLTPIALDFLARPEVAAHRSAIAAACFALAGPVLANRVRITNLGWEVDGDRLAAELRLSEVKLINDFTAAGLGIVQLAAGEFVTLQAGKPLARAMRLIVGAGTGLGVGLMTWQDERYIVHPSEAGHMDFAPTDETQDRLLVYLRRTFGRVSYERVVSGPGLLRIFAFLEGNGAGLASKPLREALRMRSDAFEAIAEFAAGRRDPLAVRALDIFIAAYGAFAGNLALATLARGGVYLGGGIAPRIVNRLAEGDFLRAFADKGRFSELLSTIPVHVVMNPAVGLHGALDEARRMIAAPKRER
jgi:glucokinase